ncbi:MAG: C40 family peptidase [Lachnospiraceae bacterium]|nr:C40 family peptidase [Lachnospiraceae bacterium]
MHTFPVKALSVLVAASIALHPVSFAAGKTQVYAATGEKKFVSPVKADPQADYHLTAATTSTSENLMHHGASGILDLTWKKGQMNKVLYKYRKNLDSLTMTSSNPAILELTQEDRHVRYQATGAGYVTVKVTFVLHDLGKTKNAHYRVFVFPDMTKAKLDTSAVPKYLNTSGNGGEIDLYLNTEEGVRLPDMELESTDSHKSMKSVVKVAYGRIHLLVTGAGTDTITFTIDQVKFRVKVKGRSLEPVFRFAKDTTKKLKIKGASASLVSWSSDNPEVAEVAEDGTVTTKKEGAAVLLASYQDMTFGCVVNVAEKEKIKAFQWAKSYAEKSVYNQALRMTDGFYDCSSLVFRAYQKQGVLLPSASSFWAPTAADLGQSLVSCKPSKKVGATKDANLKKRLFQTGDLLFETGAENKRYKGIYHVEMFGGYTFAGVNADGTANIQGTWASRKDGYYGAVATNFMCRP